MLRFESSHGSLASDQTPFLGPGTEFDLPRQKVLYVLAVNLELGFITWSGLYLCFQHSF